MYNSLVRINVLFDFKSMVFEDSLVVFLVIFLKYLKRLLFLPQDKNLEYRIFCQDLRGGQSFRISYLA